MSDTGPIVLAAQSSDDDAKMVRLTVDYDDLDQFIHVYETELANGRMAVPKAVIHDPGTPVLVVSSFPGLVRPLHLGGRVQASDGGAGVELDELDDAAKQALAEHIERIKQRDPKYVVRVVRVLVVEDNPHCAKLIQEGLRLAGKRAFGNQVVFEVPMASNAADAFTFLHSRPIDVLITDIYLGGVSGTTVIEHVRRDSGLRSIPVLAISAGDDATREVALQAGADVFLPKPVRLRQIVGTVGRVLNLEQVAWR